MKLRFLAQLGLSLLALPLSAMGGSEAPSNPGGLRALADKAGVSLGAAVRPEYFEDESYAATLKANFNYMTPENDLKWEMIRPSPTKFDFSGSDQITDFAAENSMTVRGHALLWHNQNPSWLKDLGEDNAAWVAAMKEHVTNVVTYYRGKIRDWDVANEVIEDDATMRDTVWKRHLGPNYLDQVYRWARDADPKAHLFLNDYSTEAINAKSDALYALVKGMKERGVPIDGVGFQCHLDGKYMVDFDSVARNFKRFADLGVEVQITELDVRMSGAMDSAAKKKQADIYAGMLKALIGAGGKTCILWGVTDLHSWVPGFFPGTGSALLFDEDYAPKPAVRAIVEVLTAKPAP